MEVDDVPDGVRRLLAAPDMAGLGVLLVEDSFYHALPPLARRTMARRPLPMVVPFPGPAWSALPEAPESFIAELLRQAIGYRVRLA
jgi:vacuolar-type H+-ATPase subunit F/Vma7